MDESNCLGNIITKDGKNKNDIDSRLKKAKQFFQIPHIALILQLRFRLFPLYIQQYPKKLL